MDEILPFCRWVFLPCKIASSFDQDTVVFWRSSVCCLMASFQTLLCPVSAVGVGCFVRFAKKSKKTSPWRFILTSLPPFPSRLVKSGWLVWFSNFVTRSSFRVNLKLSNLPFEVLDCIQLSGEGFHWCYRIKLSPKCSAVKWTSRRQPAVFTWYNFLCSKII